VNSRSVRVAAVAAIAVVLIAGCGGGGSGSAQGVASGGGLRFSVSAASAGAYDPVDVRLSGLKPGAAVTITSDSADFDNVHWHGSGQFQADASGVVDLAKQPSTAGTYTGVDEMGLLWSMDAPQPADSAGVNFDSNCSAPFSVTLTAVVGKASATTTLTRLWQVPGVTTTALSVAAEAFEGRLVMPSSGGGTRPAVLLFGGSEGGNLETCRAEMLAEKGFPALAVGYFGEPGTPKTLNDIPIEYFAKAAKYLAGQPGVDRGHITVLSLSRGSEAALLLAQNYPDLIHGAIVMAPSAQVGRGFPTGPHGWTLGGVELPTDETIPVDKISGPVLALTGADDKLWGSFIAVPQIMRELDAAHNPFPHKAVLYPNAGHDMVDDPWMPVIGHLDERGGTRPGNVAAASESWNQILSFLRALPH